MKALVIFMLSDMMLPRASLGGKGLTLVGILPAICPSPACCATALNAATEHVVPSLVMSKYLTAL